MPDVVAQGLEVLVLGTTEVRAAGTPVQVSRPLERALIVRLAFAGGQPVPDESLATAIWGEDAKATERLRVLAHRLRRTLGEQADAVRRSPAGYSIAARIPDLAMVEQLYADMRACADPESVRALAIEALGQWRGAALADVRRTPFGSAEAARLDVLQLDLQVQRIEAEVALGLNVLADLEQLVAANPLHEQLVGLLAVALYRAGRQMDAFDRIAHLRKALTTELGVDPSPAIGELELRLLRHDPSLGPGLGPAEKLPQRSWEGPGNSFVGREDELATLVDRLPAAAILTLTGPIGIGKTRLARELAATVEASGRPVAWLDLAEVRGADGVLPAFAAAAGIETGPDDPLPRGLERLAGALLVIDNAEHLVDAVAELAGAIQRQNGLTVLVTSQRPLRLSSEEVHQLGPLSPYDAVALFRARSRLPADERIEHVCAAVDRLPLAIELAAGLTRVLTIEQLASRIEDQLQLLVGGTRDSGARHVSLRAAADWSHSLLEAPAQMVLRRLSVFAGGCTLEAAEQVVAGDGVEAGDVAAILAELVDRSLVTVDLGQDPPRYKLFETLRVYAGERLHEAGEESVVRGQHGEWCVELAARTERYGGPDHSLLLRELRAEEANLRAAIERALSDSLDGDSGRVLEIAAPTWWYWWSRGFMAEGREWLRRALAGADPAPTAKRAIALRACASLTRNSGDYEQGRVLGEEALRIFRELDDLRGTASVLIGLCITSMALRDFDNSLAEGRAAAAITVALGNDRLLGAALNVTGGALRCLGRTAEAERTFNESCDAWRRIDDRRGLAGTLGNLGLVATQTGQYERARELIVEGLRIYREIDLTEGMLDLVELIAGLEVAEGRPREALQMLAIATEQRLRMGAPLIVPDELDARNAAESAARQALGPAADQIALAARAESLPLLVTKILTGAADA